MTWNVLKWIAIVSMLIDHTASVFGFSGISLGGLSLYELMRGVGRMAFPIFAYGIAQGCVYTHSPRRYLARLLVFAVISEIPYQLALGTGILGVGTQNVFFTLFVGAGCCEIIRLCKAKGKGWAWVAVVPVAVLVLLCEMRHTDYGGFGVLCIVLPYLFFANKTARLAVLASVVAVIYVVVKYFTGFAYPLWWMENPQAIGPMLLETLFALAGVGLLALYNGEPGSKKGKWVFYVFYPAHLLALYGVYCLTGPVILL